MHFLRGPKTPGPVVGLRCDPSALRSFRARSSIGVVLRYPHGLWIWVQPPGGIGQARVPNSPAVVARPLGPSDAFVGTSQAGKIRCPVLRRIPQTGAREVMCAWAAC